MSKLTQLFSDGGLVGRNPSLVGGTWGWARADADGNLVDSGSGFVPCVKLDNNEIKPVTNNQMEMIAAILVFEHTDADFEGTFNCDSEVTIGRLFKGFALRNLPANVKNRAFEVVKKFHLGESTSMVQPVLLQGHPTKAELLAGVGHKHLPVSRFNKLCDELCRNQAKEQLKNVK